MQQVHDLFLSKLVLDYDYVFCITTTRSRSGIHDNAVQASYTILNDYRPTRQGGGNNTPFCAAGDRQPERVLRGRRARGGRQRLRGNRRGRAEDPRGLEHLALHTQGYMVPPDLHHLRNLIRKRGDKSVSFLSATLGTALDIKPILHCNRGVTGPVAKVKGFEAAAEKMLDFAGKPRPRRPDDPTLA